MTEHPEPPPTPAPPPVTSADALAAIAPAVQRGLVVLGLFVAASRWAPDLRAMSGSVAVLVGSVLAGRVARRLLVASADSLRLFADGVEALERLATAREDLQARARAAVTVSEPETAATGGARADPAGAAAAPTAPAGEARATALAEVRLAIRQGLWDRAGELIRDFADANPGDPAADRLGADLAAARESAVADLRARIDAARAANDPQQVLAARESLAAALDAEGSRALDRELARWFMDQVQKRLRGGRITPEVADLAARVAESFEATPEGASLRAALPTLRRSVGLCARCGKPYHGLADACPACLGPGAPIAQIPQAEAGPGDAVAAGPG